MHRSTATLRRSRPAPLATLALLGLLADAAPTTAQALGPRADARLDAKARTLKILPVADLLTRSSAVRPPRFGPLSRAPEDGSISLLRRDDFHLLHADRLIDMVRTGFGDAADEMSIRVRDRTLFATCDPKHVAQLVAMVEALRRGLGARIAIRARLYRTEATIDYPATAPATRLAELTKELELVWAGETDALSGQPVALAQEDFIRYLARTEIEVAEEAQIADPIIDSMFEGIRLVVAAHALIDTTDKVLKCQFAIGERNQELEWLSTGAQGHPAIGIPHLRASSGAFSGRVVHDGALLLTMKSHQGAGSNLLLVVQAGDAAGPRTPQVAEGRLLLLPISGLAGASLRQPIPGLGGEHGDTDGATGGYPIREWSGESEDLGEMVQELVREGLGELFDDEEGTALDLGHDGLGSSFVAVWGTPTVHDAARKVLTTLQDQWLQTAELRLTTTLRAGAAAHGTFSNLSAPHGRAEGADPVYHELCFPSLLGHTALVIKGLESAVIRDFDVEIAKKSSLSRPIMQTTFSGIVAGFRPSRQGEGYGAELSVDLQHLAPAHRQPSGQDLGGDLYHVRCHRAQFRRDGASTLDKTMLLGWGPELRDGQRDRRMQQRMQVRVR